MTEICKYCKKKMKFIREDEEFHKRVLLYQCHNEKCDYGPELEIHICTECEDSYEIWDPDEAIEVSKEEIDQDKINEFLKWLNKNNYHLCPFLDMKSEYCQNHCQENICKCQHNCNSCIEKVWNDDLGIPVCKDWKIMQEMKNLNKKLLYFAKNYHKITEWGN
jgi:hypothetical protein